MLEGNYWKRRIEVVMREYHKWRIYYKKRVSGSVHAAPCPDGTGHQRAQRGATADQERDVAGSCQGWRGTLAASTVPVGWSSVGTLSPAARSAGVCSGSPTWGDCTLPRA